MKKIFCIILLLTFVLAIGACDREEAGDSAVNDLLLSVLNSETEFTAEDGRSLLMNAYAYGYGQGEDVYLPLLAEPQEYTFVDMDGDGIDELIADITPTQTAYIVLHEEDGTVYGYLIYRRSLQDLKTDGSFMQSGGVGIEYFGRMKFNAGSYEIVHTAIRNATDGVYEIDGAACSSDEASAYADEWNSKTDVEWIPCA